MSQAAPIRCFRLTLRLDADSRSELARALHNFAEMAEREELTVGVHGGVSSGATYELLHTPEQTHERYFAELRAYLARTP